MKTSDFDFYLPDELIAKYPLEKRTSSRLLVFSNEIEHKSFKDIVNYFEKGDLLVVNNTAVIPARLYLDYPERAKRDSAHKIHHKKTEE